MGGNYIDSESQVEVPSFSENVVQDQMSSLNLGSQASTSSSCTTASGNLEVQVSMVEGSQGEGSEQPLILSDITQAVEELLTQNSVCQVKPFLVVSPES